MKIGWIKMIKRLEKEYDKARDNLYVKQPVAYALYKTWEWANRNETMRNIDKEEEDDRD